MELAAQAEALRTPRTTRSLWFNVAEQRAGKNWKKIIDTSAQWTFNKAKLTDTNPTGGLGAVLYLPDRVENTQLTDSNTFWSLLTDPDGIWAVEPEESVTGKNHFVLMFSEH